MTTNHLLSQFKGAIREAMSSSVQRRAHMRAISAKQRFPVIVWRDELLALHSESIRMHALARTKKMLSPIPTPKHSTPATSRRGSLEQEHRHTIVEAFGKSSGPRTSTISATSDDPDAIRLAPNGEDIPPLPSPNGNLSLALTNARWSNGTTLPPTTSNSNRTSRQPKDLSIATIVGVDTAPTFHLQKVDPFFTDINGQYYRTFEKKLEKLTGKNSESTNCIGEFLKESERQWSSDLRNAKLGRTKNEATISVTSLPPYPGPASTKSSSREDVPSTIEARKEMMPEGFVDDSFGLGKDYKPPTGLRNYLQIRIGTWPLYSFLLALGQIISANSYTIVLLTGSVGQSAEKLYAIASIYLAASIAYWVLYRNLPAIYSLSVPFAFYGLAFLFIGLAQFASDPTWIQYVGTGFYTVASASGGLFFALNFADEAGGRISDWMFRACTIQGTQQIWVVALWYWGHLFSSQTAQGVNVRAGDLVGTWKISAICLPIAAVLWTIGLVLFMGLPDFYRQSPGTTAAFYKAVMQRKVVIWFAVTVVLQNFFMSAPYGRNWSFLFSSEAAATWQVLLLIAAFFIGVWAVFLWIMALASQSHSWILPLTAIGLGAPRFAQILWGTSGIGLWLPWAGGAVQSALASRAIWLWLGTLDAVQGVGIGMILLMSVGRDHVAYVVTMCQVIGSATTMLSRAIAPNRLGPGPISPDISQGLGALREAWFWVALAAQLVVCVGFFKVYRKGQLDKP